jgi:hypothetical protein
METVESQPELGRFDRVWRPHAKQVEFIQLPFSIFEGLYGGAVGGGKSELLYMLPIVYGFHRVPGFHGVLFRETFPQLEASLILRAVPIYNQIGGHYDGSAHTFTFDAGGIIRFSYMENDKHARDHDTNEYQYIGFDELTAHGSTDFRYTYLTSRVRSVIPGIPPIVRSATNPGNVGHLWCRQRFIEPAPLGGKRIYDSDSETYRIFIRALLTDNPYLLKKDPGYLKRLRLLPLAEQRAKIYGDWWVFSGQVFTEWRDPFFGSRFPDEPDFACHVIGDFVPPPWMPRIVACDWGYHPGKTWVGWAVATPDRRAILYRERVWSKTNISVWGAEVARLSEPERESIVACKLDPSAWGHRGEDKTLADQIIEATGLPFDKADNDRLGGKQLLHEYLRWKQKPPSFTPAEGYDEQAAFRILRMHGPKAYRDYVDLFEPEAPETNLPKFQVTESCEAVRKAIPACIYSDSENNKKAEDVAEFIGDDPYDGTRYLIKAIDDYYNLSGSLARKNDELAQIVRDFEVTNNWDTYYRRMDKYDKKFRRPAQPTPLHRGRFSARRVARSGRHRYATH